MMVHVDVMYISHIDAKKVYNMSSPVQVLYSESQKYGSL